MLELMSTKNLNILKATLPFMPITAQRSLSNIIRVEEFSNLYNTMNQSLDYTLSACEVDNENSRTNNISELIEAVKPYLDKSEFELLNMLSNTLKAFNLHNYTINPGNNSNSEDNSIINVNTISSDNINTSDSNNKSSRDNNQNTNKNTQTRNQFNNNININALRNMLSPQQKAMFDSYSSIIRNNS